MWSLQEGALWQEIFDLDPLVKGKFGQNLPSNSDSQAYQMCKHPLGRVPLYPKKMRDKVDNEQNVPKEGPQGHKVRCAKAVGYT